jgi:alkylation response protein AidB-like acyl-CoA dehydrogenase
VDLRWSPEHEAFRREARAWLAHHRPAWAAGRRVDGRLGDEDDETWALRRDWHRRMGEAGWLTLRWPAEYGGRGLGVAADVIWNEECARLGVPEPVNPAGLRLLAPVLLRFGSDDQRRRFLPGIATADCIWCQGFSEPDAGSDLASLRTRAVRDGGDLVITGRKVWTTLAERGDWMFALVRTDPHALRHRGISFVLLDLRQPGVEIRPIRQLGGGHGFAEVILDGARTPVANVVGDVNGGWTVAAAALEHERGSAGLANYVRFRRIFADLRQIVGDDPGAQHALARSLVDIEVFRANVLRSLSAVLRDEPPGPEASVTKLFWSEWYRDATDLALEVLGPAGRTFCAGERDWLVEYLDARAGTIYAGTSEIQRNVLAERVLGLPRESG